MTISFRVICLKDRASYGFEFEERYSDHVLYLKRFSGSLFPSYATPTNVNFVSVYSDSQTKQHVSKDSTGHYQFTAFVVMK